MDLVLHELQRRVEGVVPHDLKVVHRDPVIFVPVQVLAHQQGEPQVHLHRRDELVDHLEGGFIVAERGYFVSELSDLVHDLPEGSSLLLALHLFEVLDDRFNEVGWV